MTEAREEGGGGSFRGDFQRQCVDLIPDPGWQAEDLVLLHLVAAEFRNTGTAGWRHAILLLRGVYVLSFHARIHRYGMPGLGAGVVVRTERVRCDSLVSKGIFLWMF